MAEIRSTLEMVLERAEKMSRTAQTGSVEDRVKKGMRLGADYLRGENINLSQTLDRHDEAEKTAIQEGIIKSLLRNIVLPREKEYQKNAEKAMQGLVEIGQSNPDLIGIFSEMKSILDRYPGHKKQLRQQLEDSFAQQMEQMEQNLAGQTGMKFDLQPSQHPKFAEEWQRLKTELNSQYSAALDQQKNMITLILTGS